MAPSLAKILQNRQTNHTFDGSWRKNATPDGLVLEAWGEGCMFGALMIMACVTIANMRKGVLLHKLILLEVSLLDHAKTKLIGFH